MGLTSESEFKLTLKFSKFRHLAINTTLPGLSYKHYFCLRCAGAARRYSRGLNLLSGLNFKCKKPKGPPGTVN